MYSLTTPLSRMVVAAAKSLPSWPNVTKHFTSIIYKYSKEVRVFVPGRPFQPNIMFVGEARA